ncbi:MAG: hypothetical protein ACYDCJ_09480, partial [Gammaproteobacteria bacterium]
MLKQTDVPRRIKIAGMPIARDTGLERQRLESESAWMVHPPEAAPQQNQPMPGKHRLISDCPINGEAAAGLHRACDVRVGVWIRGAARAAGYAIRVAWHTGVGVAAQT